MASLFGAVFERGKPARFRWSHFDTIALLDQSFSLENVRFPAQVLTTKTGVFVMGERGAGRFLKGYMRAGVVGLIQEARKGPPALAQPSVASVPYALGVDPMPSAARWETLPGPDGLPIWRGSDSIINQHVGTTRHANPLILLGAGGSAFLTLLAFASGSAMGIVFAMICLPFTASMAWAYFAVKKEGNFPAQKWFDEKWGLMAGPSGFMFLRDGSHYRPEERWTAAYDAIASVEYGRSKDWTAQRKMGAMALAVTDVEYQVFFAMNNGARGVIYSANADRESCAALASSIRAYLIGLRNAVPIAAPSTPAASPSGEGFDL